MKKLFTFYVVVLLLFSGTIKSQDFWTEITEPEPGMTAAHLYVAPNDNLIAESGLFFVYYSNDNGFSWEIGQGLDFMGFDNFATSDYGVIFSSCGSGCYYVWKSVDNGVSWLTNEIYPFSFDDIAINSQDILFAIRNDKVYRSQDNAVSWEEIYVGFEGATGSVIEVNEYDDIYLGTEIFGDGGAIYKSIDNGITWDLISGDLFNESSIEKIIISKNNEIYISTSTQGLFRSDANGSTWVNIFSDKASWIEDIEFNSKEHLFLLTTYNIYRSLDKGETWQEINSGLPNPNNNEFSILNEIAIDSDDYIYGITAGNGAFKSASPTTFGIQNNFSIENLLTVLNYPNPCTDKTSIHFTVPDRSFITLKVYDGIGNLIATLVDTEKAKGNYSVQFKTVNLPVGLYFYILSNNKTVSSGKMTVIK